MRSLQNWIVLAVASSAFALAAGCGGSDGGGGGGSGGAGGQADSGTPGGQGGSGQGGMGGGGAGGQGGSGQGGMGMGGNGAGGMGMGGNGAGGMGMGGSGAGGMVPPINDEPLPAVNDYGPSARVTSLDIPADALAAQAAGCAVVGANGGSGLGALVGLAGGMGLNDFVQADDMGKIRIIILGQAQGWAAGQKVSDLNSVTLNLFNGEQDDMGNFQIDPRSFQDGTMNPLIQFANTQVAANGQLMSSPAEFSLSLPVIEGLTVSINLESTQLLGQLYVDTAAPGFGIRHGQLSGYLTHDSIIQLIQGIQAACAGDNPPSFCSFVNGIIQPGQDPETALGLILGLVGGFDSKVNADGSASMCDVMGNDCNAVSVCLLVEMTGQVISGVAPADQGAGGAGGAGN